MDSVSHRVVQKQEFLMLESLCALEFFRQPQGLSRLSPRANGSQVFRCFVQALGLYQAKDGQSIAQYLQVAQLIVLKAFQGLLLSNNSSSGSAGSSLPLAQNNQFCYMALLTRHYQNALHSSALLFRESLQFFQSDIQRAWRQIASAEVRVQLIWVGIQLAARFQVVPLEQLCEQLHFEIQESFTGEQQENDLQSEQANANGANATFNDGKLGGNGAGAGYRNRSKHEGSIETLVAVVECMKTVAQMQPQLAPQIQRQYEQLRHFVASNSSAASLENHA